MVICAILNIGMNVLLIPRLGINGAALATLISYGILGGGAWIVSQRFLATGFPWLDALKFGLLSTIMYLAVSAISFASDWATLVARVAAGVALYSLLVLVFDQQTRNMARRVINKFSSAFSA
jgi:O-antigen/teichoic acid export membrane protein